VYEYGNARVRAMKGRLLSRRALEGLVERYDVNQVVSALAQTDYAPDISAALAKRGGVECVEEALRLNLARTTRALLRFYQGEARELVELLVERYDLFNLLTILRGRVARASPEEIAEALLPGGRLGEPVLVELARQADVRQVVDLLATWRIAYARPLTAAMREYSQSGDLAVLEVALLKYAYGQAIDRLSRGGRNVQVVRRAFGDEIDAVNLTTILRICQQRQRPEASELRRQLIEHGTRLDVDGLISLCELEGVDKVLARLSGTPYGAVLNGALDQFVATGRVSSLQRALERHLTQESVRLFHGDPLGIDVVVAYLAAKNAELANLRLISRGIWLRLGKEEILEGVWVPGT